MPSGSRRRQCTYKEGRYRCRRDGDGTPALCNPHKIVVAEETRRAEREARPGGAIRSVVDDFLNGRHISSDKVASAVNEFAWGLGGLFGGAGPDLFSEKDPYDHASGRFQHEADNDRRAPRHREYSAIDELAKKREAVRKAKVELGFAADERVTMQQVKDRQRQLARRYHPDRPGGSLVKMQAVNSAVDVLEHAL